MFSKITQSGNPVTYEGYSINKGDFFEKTKKNFQNFFHKSKLYIV